MICVGASLHYFLGSLCPLVPCCRGLTFGLVAHGSWLQEFQQSPQAWDVSGRAPLRWQCVRDNDKKGHDFGGLQPLLE
jgi:hypothetical protein